MLVDWRNAGIKTYIYSSGSREAQRLFFGHSQAGDLRPFLSGFFDTTSGPKTEAASYANIQQTLGVDDADQVGVTCWYRLARCVLCNKIRPATLSQCAAHPVR